MLHVQSPGVIGASIQFAAGVAVGSGARGGSGDVDGVAGAGITRDEEHDARAITAGSPRTSAKFREKFAFIRALWNGDAVVTRPPDH